jgi:hypothetical protein
MIALPNATHASTTNADAQLYRNSTGTGRHAQLFRICTDGD